jgi:hypothetical protein
LVGDGLWSIDLPPGDRFRRQLVGPAVGCPYAMDHISGSNRRGELLFHLGQIDLFIHDSLHSERNVRFDLDRAMGGHGSEGCTPRR